MSSVLVTGAAGFIGSHISEALLKNGISVVGIDSVNRYYSPLLKKHNIRLLQSYNSFQFYKINIESADAIHDLFKTVQPEFVIHCAARAGVRASISNPQAFAKTNIIGSKNILESVKQYSPNSRVILLSSSSVYGLQKQSPFVETMELNPISPYAVTKRAMEKLARNYHDQYGLQAAVLRLFSVYGPRGRMDMAPFLAIQHAELGIPFEMYGTNENNKRDWTYITDVVESVMSIIDHFPQKGFEIFNIGSGHPIGIEDFVNILSEKLKNNLDVELLTYQKEKPLEDMPITFADVSKAMRHFGYLPRISFSEGIEKTIRYYQQNRSMYLQIFHKK